MLDVPQLPGKIDVIIVRILKTQHLVPQSVYLLLAVAAYILERRLVVHQLAVFKYRHMEFPHREISECLFLPCEIRVEQGQRLGRVDSFVIHAELIRDSLAVALVYPVELLEMRVGYLRNVLGYLDFRGYHAVFFHCGQLVNSAEYRLAARSYKPLSYAEKVDRSSLPQQVGNDTLIKAVGSDYLAVGVAKLNFEVVLSPESSRIPHGRFPSGLRTLSNAFIALGTPLFKTL